MLNKKELIKLLEGVQTIESIINILKVNRTRVIYIIHVLRKEGYVKTRRLSNKKRVYYISKENLLGGKSYYEIINNYSPIKVSSPKTYKIYGREPSLEEALIFAVKTNSIRVILAALSLFKRISNWKELYSLAKKNNVHRKVGALYDLSRRIMKVRKMPHNYRSLMLPKKEDDFLFVVSPIKSKDFKEIENEWKVYLPFNEQDFLGVYVE